MHLTSMLQCKCLHIVKMMEIVKEAVREFNVR